MIYFDEDSDARFFPVPAGKMTECDLRRIVDSMEENGVGTLILGVNARQMNFPSKSFECYTDTPVKPDDSWEYRRYANIKALIDAGIDPNGFVFREASKRGIRSWISFRVNDMHDGEEPESAIHPKFWREHPEYRISEVPYENSYDFSFEFIREMVLGEIRESLERYDVDGFLLDFLRFPTYFKHSEARSKTAILSDFVRKASGIAREISEKRGHKIVLAARVPLKRENAERLGMDVGKWAENGWIDHLFIGEFLLTQAFDAPVEEWKKIGNIPVTVSLESGYKPYPEAKERIPGSAVELRGAALSALERGSDGISLFNLMAIRDSAEGRDRLKNLDNPAFLRRSERIYRPAWDDLDLTIAQQDRINRLGEKAPFRISQLPLEIAPGTRRSLTLRTDALNANVKFRMETVPEFSGEMECIPGSPETKVFFTNKTDRTLRIDLFALRILPE